MRDKRMNVTVVASVRNTLDALNRVVSMLRGRDFRVVSLSSARSEQPDMARLTIVVDAAHTRPSRVASCLNRLEEVWGVRQVESRDVIRREVALVKIMENAVEQLPGTTLLSGAARVIESSGGAAILEIVGTPEEVDSVIGFLPPASILEMARPGQLVMVRGSDQTTMVTPPSAMSS
jgi:acetolactate synthase-1/3 small subunit